MQPGMQLIRVTGMDGAKAYQMPPNSVVPLFDADNDIVYVKSTDGAGFPTIRAFAFQPVENPTPAVPGALRSGALPEHLRLQRRPEPVLW